MAKTRSKGLFLEISEYSVLAARASSLVPPLTLEEVRERPAGTAEEIGEMVSELMGTQKGKFSPTVAGVYPKGRFVRRSTMDNPVKAKDPAYLVEYVQQQFQIDLGKNMVGVLNGETGAFITGESGFPKELIFCGGPLTEVTEQQQMVVAAGGYPERLEIGSVATIGGVANYLACESIKTPALILEIGQESSQVFIVNGGKLDIARPIPHGLNSMFPVLQQELGLKDEDSAKKLFYSNTFDFTEIGPALLKKMLKELQASTGFYEVQTGQTIGKIHLSLLPKSLSWMSGVLARALGVDTLDIRYDKWLKNMGVEVAAGVELAGLDSRWLGLFSLIGRYEPKTEGKPETKPEAHAGVRT